MRTTLVHSGSSSSLSGIFESETKLNPGGSKEDGKKLGTKSKSGSSETQSFFNQLVRNKRVRSTFPILTWAEGYDKDKAVADLIAGVTVGLTVLPQGLAYATVAGLPPIYGLYSSFVGCFVYLFLGGARAITVGPSAINCVLTRKYVHGRPPEYAVFLCFATGVITFFMSILRVGFISNFISAPVNSAFTSGVSLTIVATQLKSLLGLRFEGEGILTTVSGLIENIHNVKKWDTILSAICCLVLFVLEGLPKLLHCLRDRSPKFYSLITLIATSRSIIVIAASTIVVSNLGSDQPFSLVGEIPPGLPAFRPPPFSIFDPADNRTHSFVDIITETRTAFVVLPLLGVMGHVSIAKALSDSERVDPTQETLSVAMSNLISCFFSSMPIGGSLSRSIVNYMTGVKTPFGGIYTGVIVILALQFLTPYFYCIPKPSLGAVIICSVIHMVDFKIILSLWRCKKMDLIPWAVTFGVTVVIGLDIGILAGILVSACFLLYYAARPRVKILKGETMNGTQLIMVALDRSLTFPSVDYISYEIMKCARLYGNAGLPVVINCQHIQFADFTAATAFRDLLLNMHKQGYSLIFFQMKGSVRRIVGSEMVTSKVPFILCQTNEELELLLDKGTADIENGNWREIRDGGPKNS